MQTHDFDLSTLLASSNSVNPIYIESWPPVTTVVGQLSTVCTVAQDEGDDSDEDGGLDFEEINRIIKFLLYLNKENNAYFLAALREERVVKVVVNYLQHLAWCYDSSTKTDLLKALNYALSHLPHLCRDLDLEENMAYALFQLEGEDQAEIVGCIRQVVAAYQDPKPVVLRIAGYVGCYSAYKN